MFLVFEVWSNKYFRMEIGVAFGIRDSKGQATYMEEITWKLKNISLHLVIFVAHDATVGKSWT